jgi:hypothetical protein
MPLVSPTQRRSIKTISADVRRSSGSAEWLRLKATWAISTLVRIARTMFPTTNWRHAIRYHLFLHTGDTYSTIAKVKYAHPLLIDDVAVDHRDVKFVLAHFGNPWLLDTAEVSTKTRMSGRISQGYWWAIGPISKRRRSGDTWKS